MSAVPAMAFLDAVTGYARNSSTSSADRPIRLAIIDPDYDPFGGGYPHGAPPAQVTFEGETTLSGKAYAVAPGYVPQAGDRCYMVPIGSTYLISGKVRQDSTQGFYSNQLGYAGVEFGEGNYFDTEAGLFLQTDAEIQGDLTVNGWDQGRGLIYAEERSGSSANGASTEAVAWSSASITFTAGRAIRMDCNFSTTNNTANNWTFSRVRKATASGTILKEFARIPNIVAGTVVYGPFGSFYFMTGAGGTTTLAMTLQTSGSALASYFGATTHGVGSSFELFDVGPSSQFTSKANIWPVLF